MEHRASASVLEPGPAVFASLPGGSVPGNSARTSAHAGGVIRFVLLASVAFGTVGAGNGEISKSFPSALADALVRDPDIAPCARSAHAQSNAAYADANFDFSNVELRD